MKIMSRGKTGRPKVEKTKEHYSQYFYQHVHFDECGCHLWTAAKNNIGYGMFRYLTGMATTHRVVMDLEGHDIDGKVVYHTCDNYHCVNPEHLRIGTVKEKAQVMTKKGRSGKIWSDPKLYRTCKYCGYTGSPAVIGRLHNEKCKHKP